MNFKKLIITLSFLSAIGGFFGTYSFVSAYSQSLTAQQISQIKDVKVQLGILQSELNYVSPEHIFNRVLTLGSKGSDVMALQKFLNARGYVVAHSGPSSLGNETSYFGPGMQDALAKFQFASGVAPAHGYFGRGTMNLINPASVQAQIVASSSNQIFAYPHSVMVLGNKVVIGTVKENIGRIVMFTDAKDLSHYVATTTPGFMSLAYVDYDSINHRLYFVSSRTDNNHLEILSVDPDTLAWMPVFEYGAIAGVGLSTMQTDGSYVYAATQSIPSYMIKIRISDWSLQATNYFPDGPGFHSSVLHTYSNRTEWYVNTFSIPSIFYKVDTNNFSYSSTTIAQGGDITDDVYFRPTDDRGGLLYLPSERGFGTDVVNTASMSSTHYADIPDSYGFFSDGTDLYSAAPREHQIIKYLNFDLSKPVYIQLPGPYVANEWFKTSNGNTYFTEFGNPSAVYQYLVY